VHVAYQKLQSRLHRKSNKMYLIISAISALIILAAGAILFFLGKKHGFWGYFLLGWVFQILLSLPAGFWQALAGWPHIDVSGFGRRLLIPFIGWPFNAGGFTVRTVFETTVGPLEFLVGHRSSTVLSNMPYYAFLLLIQGSILAGLFAWRYKKKQTYKDWFVICMGGLFLVNSLINVRWFWAGT
jgi:hypothetical protein